MGDPLCHVEFLVEDGNRARAFYARVFGWSFRRETSSFHWVAWGALPPGAVAPGAVTAAFQENPRGGRGGILVFVAVEDLDATLRRVEEAGGRVDAPPRWVEGHGRYALLRDCEGNLLGAWERAPPPGSPGEGDPASG